MEFIDLNIPKLNQVPATGKLLIAEPFLGDPNFSRSVVFLCDYSIENGAMGFVLNRSTDIMLGDVLPDIYKPFTNVYQGGPVELDTLHILHRAPTLLGGNKVVSNIYFGGSFEALQECIMANTCQPEQVRLLVGYSGWSAGQLEQELKEGAWLVADATEEILFETNPQDLWKKAVRLLGNRYSYLANTPLNPQYN